MSPESPRLAGVLLVILPSIVYGGVSILSMLVSDPWSVTTPCDKTCGKRDTHTGDVLITLSLVVLPYVDEVDLLRALKAMARYTTPAAAILLRSGVFLSVQSPTATEPNWMINLAYLNARVLVVGLLALGVGLLRRPRGRS